MLDYHASCSCCCINEACIAFCFAAIETFHEITYMYLCTINFVCKKAEWVMIWIVMFNKPLWDLETVIRFISQVHTGTIGTLLFF